MCTHIHSFAKMQLHYTMFPFLQSTVLTWQIAAASNVHFDSIFIMQQHSMVSFIPSIVLAPTYFLSIEYLSSISLSSQCNEL